jgi:hypothetical protein
MSTKRNKIHLFREYQFVISLAGPYCALKVPIADDAVLTRVVLYLQRREIYTKKKAIEKLILFCTDEIPHFWVT